MDANSSAISRSKPNAQVPTAPSRITAVISPGTASVRIGTMLRLNRPRSVVAAPSNSNGGRRTNKMMSWESDTCPNTCSTIGMLYTETTADIASPASSSATV